MSLYTSLAAKSLALLTKFGRDVTLRKPSGGTYDTNSSSVTGSSNTDTVLKGVLFDMDGQTQDDNTLIQENDKKCLLQAGGPVPTVSDTLIVGGVNYAILDVKAINPAGTPVLYTLHLRRG